MASESTLQTIIKISKENYEILINGGSVEGYTYDPNAMYLVKGGFDYITDSEIRDLWNGGSGGDIYIKGGVIYSADEISDNVAYITLGEDIKNNTIYI